VPEVGPGLRLGVRIMAGFAGVRALARVAGVSECQVTTALNDQWITPRTSRNLGALAERPVQEVLEELSHHASLVAAVGARLRLGALYAHGWPVSTIGLRTGYEERRLGHILRGGTRRVRAQLWRDLCRHTDPMLRIEPKGPEAVAARMRARERGFLRMAELEEDILDLVEPWRTQEVHRRAWEVVHGGWSGVSARQARKRGERSEVLATAYRLMEAERMRLRRSQASTAPVQG
jgi:hypothetical protein